MPLTAVKVVVHDTEEPWGPVFYEIKHARNGRTWSVRQRYRTLHAMTEALRSEKAELPSERFPPKRWQIPLLQVPCAAMVASELEDRRRGLQDYLIALSQLETSWNSPTVTRVLCAEEDKVEKACGYADIGAHEAHTEAGKIGVESDASFGPPQETTTAVAKPAETQAAPAAVSTTTDPARTTSLTPAPAGDAVSITDACHSELEPIATAVPSDSTSVPPVDDVSTSAAAARAQALDEKVAVAAEGEGGCCGEEIQLETLDTNMSEATSPLVPAVDASTPAGATAAEPDVGEGNPWLVEAKTPGAGSEGAEETANSIVGDKVASSLQQPLVAQPEDGGVVDAAPAADATIAVPDGGDEGDEEKDLSTDGKEAASFAVTSAPQGTYTPVAATAKSSEKKVGRGGGALPNLVIETQDTGGRATDSPRRKNVLSRARRSLKKTVNRVLQAKSRDTTGRLSAGTTPVSSSTGVGKFFLPLTSTATGARNFFLSPSPRKTAQSGGGNRGEAYFASGSDSDSGNETADADISDTISAPTSAAGGDAGEETIDILIAPPAGSMLGNAPHQAKKNRLPSALTKMIGPG